MRGEERDAKSAKAAKPPEEEGMAHSLPQKIFWRLGVLASLAFLASSPRKGAA
jgi:hypothetical protein